jgi:hypothetical protein
LVSTRRFGQGVVRVLGKRLMKEPDDASDYIATIEADLGHDASEALARIAAPTLVIAGSRDFFYPDAIVGATAEGIPRARPRRYEGVGHGVSKTHKRSFEDDVLGFLHLLTQPSSGRIPRAGLGPRLVHTPTEPSGSQRSPAVHRSPRSQVRSGKTSPGAEP